MDGSKHLQQESLYDDILRVALSRGEKQQAKTVADQGRTLGATRAALEKTTGGAAVSIYKKIRDITKKSDRKEVKVTISKVKEKEKSSMIDTKAILDIIRVTEPK
ncbi:hypothetical protein GJ744_008222 [Endocarpon pusillum]|uniref:Uncharacterized protein n=1 Tax=Endocarpon pusillum TaxID=364733 RepID=A0A8H7DXV2_9EURO|nr:hypothetical protein GJ744_008222 [Endocarpon pusillum]